ncbi:2'-5' RNA ligase family protein [Azospirillum rugosum]|uniref:2'-5' RNA ligase n=1 Tax=Azospirillum rugosum TaxID=416170 RepID=A0ABS4SUT8_9PROT|nr:2'-5' RNA ligase family protein [Azospirillum rugosum]MBP2296202.1 2'-5' RNA ligase [Azospirillum rugosum]MDQ0527113.1 2'-5' RNA ligase [Azospirillum rugosum]
MRDAPLILTLMMDEASFRRLDDLRRAHFPPARNLIPAHLTLFHHLPGDALDSVAATLAGTTARQPAFSLRATGPRFLGRGVAIAFEAPDLADLRKRLAAGWSAWLTPQDRQGFRPHVTIQNKVPSDEARALHERLGAGFQPFDVRAEGLLLWRYLGGPWEAVGEFPFRGAVPCNAFGGAS